MLLCCFFVVVFLLDVVFLLLVLLFTVVTPLFFNIQLLFSVLLACFLFLSFVPFMARHVRKFVQRYGCLFSGGSMIRRCV